MEVKININSKDSNNVLMRMYKEILRWGKEHLWQRWDYLSSHRWRAFWGALYPISQWNWTPVPYTDELVNIWSCICFHSSDPFSFIRDSLEHLQKNYAQVLIPAQSQGWMNSRLSEEGVTLSFLSVISLGQWEIATTHLIHMSRALFGGLDDWKPDAIGMVPSQSSRDWNFFVSSYLLKFVCSPCHCLVCGPCIYLHMVFVHLRVFT